MKWVDPLPDDALSLCAARQFTQYFTADPDGVWAAPGRVNLIGEHVDYAGGLCLPMALPHATAVAVRRRDDGLLRVQTGDDPQVHTLATDDLDPARPVAGWPAYPAGVVWALRDLLPHVTGADVAMTTALPIGAGLASSAALECALALALADLAGVPTDDTGRTALAAACVAAENEYVGAPTGGMDQTAALRSVPGHALLLDCTSGETTEIPVDFAAADLMLLVIDTRAPHRLVDGRYARRRAAVDEVMRRLGVRSMRDLDESALAVLDAGGVLHRRARHVVTEIDRVRTAVEILRSGDIRGLGAVLDASHRSLRDDFEVSCVELGTAVEAVREAGALGARMIGGGFGGSAIALVERGRARHVARRVADTARERGLPEPAFLRAHAAAAARRVR